MKPMTLFISLAFLMSSFVSKAQYFAFSKSGVITYEKRVNVFAILQKKAGESADARSILEAYKKDHPQFIVLKSELRFSKGRSLFVPKNSPPSPLIGYFGEDPLMTQINTVHMNTQAKGLYTVQKNILGMSYLVQDTIPNIKWRITDETREIAGHLCRRANGLMLDSIYVVAFYTNDIHLSVGPESFHGLPGIILGVALPYYHVSWFASKVDLGGFTQQFVQAPTKGKRVTTNELHMVLTNILQPRRSSYYNIIDPYFF